MLWELWLAYICIFIKNDIGKEYSPEVFFFIFYQALKNLTQRCDCPAVDAVEDRSKGGVNRSEAADNADVPGKHGKHAGTGCNTGGFKKEHEGKRPEDKLELPFTGRKTLIHTIPNLSNSSTCTISYHTGHRSGSVR